MGEKAIFHHPVPYTTGKAIKETSTRGPGLQGKWGEKGKIRGEGNHSTNHIKPLREREVLLQEEKRSQVQGGKKRIPDPTEGKRISAPAGGRAEKISPQDLLVPIPLPASAEGLRQEFSPAAAPRPAWEGWMEGLEPWELRIPDFLC